VQSYGFQTGFVQHLNGCVHLTLTN
jgi:hypothetical protein